MRRSRIKRFLVFPWHPMLLAACFSFSLYSTNIPLFSVSEVSRPVLVAICLAFVPLFVTQRFVRMDWDRSGVVAFALIFIGTYWASAAQLISSSRFTIVSAYIVGAALIFAICVRLSAVGSKMTIVLNVLAATMLVQAVGLSLWHTAWAISPWPQHSPIHIGISSRASVDRVGLQNPLPTIVHIVLDGYSRTDVLDSLYHFDNSNFLDELQALGFHVFPDAHAPYNQTLLSMAAVFSGDYLYPEMLRLSSRTDRGRRRMLGGFLTRGPITQALQGVDYQLGAADTGIRVFESSGLDYLGKKRSGGLTLFEHLVVERTAIALADGLEDLLQGGAGQAGSADGGCKLYHNCVLRYALNHGLPDRLAEPYLYYLHIIAPHPPFQIDRNSRDITDGPDQTLLLWDGVNGHQSVTEKKFYLDGYLEKLRYLNGALLELLPRILTEAPKPLIVLMHGDHGGGLLLDPESAVRTCMKERFGVLLAVFASDPRLRQSLVDGLARSPSIVNLYRAVFNAVFGAQLPMLSDQSYFAPWSNLVGLEPVEEERREAECVSPIIVDPPTSPVADDAAVNLIRIGR